MVQAWVIGLNNTKTFFNILSGNSLSKPDFYCVPQKIWSSKSLRIVSDQPSLTGPCDVKITPKEKSRRRWFPLKSQSTAVIRACSPGSRPWFTGAHPVRGCVQVPLRPVAWAIVPLLPPFSKIVIHFHSLIFLLFVYRFEWFKGQSIWIVCIDNYCINLGDAVLENSIESLINFSIQSNNWMTINLVIIGLENY